MTFPTSMRTSSAWLIFAIILGLGAAVFGITAWQRVELRDQILRREGESLYAVTVLQRTIERDRLGDLGLGAEDEELVLIALQTSRLQGVLGVQVFNAAGVALPGSASLLVLEPPAESDWPALRAGRPVVRFTPAASWEQLLGAPAIAAGSRFPLLEILVPLHEPDGAALDGAARFVLEGGAVAREFALLDRQLIRQAALVWALAAVLLGGGAGWALRRLRRAHAVLEGRTLDLARANAELSLAAKTSALGAVTAHLVHGLRNPMAGIERFIEDRGTAEPPQEAMREAVATARRMREMINEVVALMHEERSGVRYEIPCRELLDGVVARVEEIAKERGVRIRVAVDDAVGPVTNRQAGLIASILANLARNACEAVTAGSGEIVLRAGPLSDGAIEFQVEDNGPGVPESARDGLFEPRQSAKPGGAGIGLAISRQLAAHLSAELSLAANRPGGACFSLRVPPAAQSQPPPEAFGLPDIAIDTR